MLDSFKNLEKLIRYIGISITDLVDYLILLGDTIYKIG
jgi:hypothetical protein